MDRQLKAKASAWRNHKMLQVPVSDSTREPKSKAGIRKKIETPQDLWELACDYFTEVEENPYHKVDFIKGGESAGTHVYLDQMKPFTWQGLEVYIFIRTGLTKLDDYRFNVGQRYGEFQAVLDVIGKIIFDNKFSGAVAGFFNGNIVARELNLAETTNVRVQPLFSDSDLDSISPVSDSDAEGDNSEDEDEYDPNEDL